MALFSGSADNPMSCGVSPLSSTQAITPTTPTLARPLPSSTRPRVENTRPRPLAGFRRENCGTSAPPEKFQPPMAMGAASAAQNVAPRMGRTINSARAPALVSAGQMAFSAIAAAGLRLSESCMKSANCPAAIFPME